MTAAAPADIERTLESAYLAAVAHALRTRGVAVGAVHLARGRSGGTITLADRLGELTWNGARTWTLTGAGRHRLHRRGRLAAPVEVGRFVADRVRDDVREGD